MVWGETLKVVESVSTSTLPFSLASARILFCRPDRISINRTCNILVSRRVIGKKPLFIEGSIKSICISYETKQCKKKSEMKVIA